MVAAVRDKDPSSLAEQPRQVYLDLLARRREPDQDDGAAAADHSERLVEGRSTADDIENEVGGGWLRVRRAETCRLLELALVEIDRADLRRARDARALDHREADRATADHGDARALPHLGRLEHRHDAGRDRATDQACLLDGQLARHLHGGHGRYDSVRRERSSSEDRRQLGAVVPMQAARRRRRLLALARLAALANRAPPAGPFPSDHDPIAGLQMM